MRIPKTEELDEHNKIKDYFNKRIPYSDSWNIKNYFVTYVIVGIYPYCYIIPTIVNNYENLLTQEQVIVPFEVADTNEELNEFLKKINSNIQIENKYKWGSEHRRLSNFKSSWKDEDLFRQIETPVFLFHHYGTYENQHFKSYDYIIKNIRISILIIVKSICNTSKKISYHKNDPYGSFCLDNSDVGECDLIAG